MVSTAENEVSAPEMPPTVTMEGRSVSHSAFSVLVLIVYQCHCIALRERQNHLRS